MIGRHVRRLKVSPCRKTTGTPAPAVSYARPCECTVPTLLPPVVGLIVALGRRAFDWLADAMDQLPSSDDPLTDLVEAGVRVFRRLVVEHPAELVPQFRSEAHNAMARLHSRFQRLQENRLLDDRSISEAAFPFHALCEGLAAIELRCILTIGQEDRIWRNGLTALISGFCPPAT